jgi:hypothetical protein
MDENIKACESCGAWTYVPTYELLMGQQIFCSFCKEGKKNVAKSA